MPQADFLRQYVELLLEESGIAVSFTEKQREGYIVELLSLVEERIGIELVPKLSSQDMETFTDMVKNAAATPREWSDFWHAALSTFEQDLHAILLQFAEEFKTLLSK